MPQVQPLSPSPSQAHPAPAPRPTPSLLPSSDTSGWKTYENKEFGFAFDYPGGWEVEAKRTDVQPYLFYEIKLWAPDQKDDQLRSEFGPRMTVTISEGSTLEQFQKSIKDTEQIKLRSGITGYHKKDQTSEWLSTYVNERVIVFGAQQDTSLNMDIVDTFRLVKK